MHGVTVDSMHGAKTDSTKDMKESSFLKAPRSVLKRNRSVTTPRKPKKPLSSSKSKKASTASASSKTSNLYEVEEIMATIIKKPGAKFSLFLAGILYVATIAGAQTLFHSLTGHVPYDKWKCLGTPDSNQKCFEATRIEGNHSIPNIYNLTTICENNLKAGLHFLWAVPDVTYFSTEWGLYCDDMGPLKDFVVQMFFIGSAVGTLIAWFLYDSVGRRSSAVIGLVITLSASTFCALSPNAYIMMIHRFILGLAQLIYLTAVYIYLMEIVPFKFRVILSTLFNIFWALGYIIEITIFILVENWGTLMGIMGLLSTLSIIPLLFGPDSPRFKLVTLRREIEARKELELLFQMNGKKFRFKDHGAALTFHEQRMDEITGTNILRLHPKFMKELLVLLALWFVVGFSYYGFQFSFHMLSDDHIHGTFFNAGGEIFANFLTVVPLLVFGRKLTCQLFYFVAGASFVVMMIPFPGIKDLLTVEEFAALIGNMGVSGAFSCLYLYTFELTPTTHRGRIFNSCQFACRIGSFLGSRSSALHGMNKHVALVLFAAMNGACFLLLFLMPRTKDQLLTPNVPVEVERRSTKCTADDADDDAPVLTRSSWKNARRTTTSVI